MVMHDRDTTFTASFDEVVKAWGVRVQKAAHATAVRPRSDGDWRSRNELRNVSESKHFITKLSAGPRPSAFANTWPLFAG